MPSCFEEIYFYSRTQLQRALLIVPAVLIPMLMLTLPIAAQTFTIFHQFRSGSGGINPESGVIFDNAGNLYGTTLNDGAFDVGTAYQITAGGKEREFSFTGINGEGDFPQYGSLIRDSTGNFYGTTSEGGTYNTICVVGCGTVFVISSTGKERVLYEFTGVNGDGQQPWSGVIRDSGGNLYGTTSEGGTNNLGIVYKISPNGEETILHNFDGSDGGFPYSGLTIDGQGNLFGTSSLGSIFEISSSGIFATLYEFSGPDGSNPLSGVSLDSVGNLYGTTNSGGAFGYGTVYEITPQGEETTLYNFTGGADGANPGYGNLARDSAGNLYGTTTTGGAENLGIVFKVDPSGTETVLHTFTGTDGRDPQGSVVLDANGNLYGTTYAGGAYGGGVVFKIEP